MDDVASPVDANVATVAPETSTDKPGAAATTLADDANSVRACSMSAQQVYERFEKLPMERRKEVAAWVRRASAEDSPVVVLPKGVDGAEGRPERWRIMDVDTQRWNDFQWKPVRWVAINSRYATPEALVRAAMAVLDDLAVPLSILVNRYTSATEAVCVDVPVRFGIAMGFIRAQARETERQLANDEPTAEEKEARDAWLAEGLSADEYRSFALQLFALRQERDPPFVLMVFRGTPERMAIVWFRDVHLASSAFCKGLFAPGFEHLSWPNYTHRASADPPKELCERPECGKCGGLVRDTKLLSAFVKHAGPWRTASRDMVTAEMRRLWATKYQVRIDAARKETEGKANEADLLLLQTQLAEQAEAERDAVAKRVEDSRSAVFKRCGRCKLVQYCSAECQKGDWARHGKYCVEKVVKK